MNELTKYNNHYEIIQKTVDQINKDFGPILENPLKLTGTNTPYNELFNSLHPIIKNLLENNFSQLKALYYRIDLPEKFTNKTPTNKKEAANYIVNGILERELQKVVIRHNLGTGI
jgi:hypothetical protein